MDQTTIVSCIGKAEDAPDVQQVLAALGATKKLKMPPDDIDVRHSLHDQGLCLVFKPEGPKSSRLILNAVQFVSSCEEGYSTFAGALPGGLSFSDGPPQANAKLGEPFFSKPKLRREIWNYGVLQLAVNYSRQEPQRIAVVTVELPPKA